MSKCLSWFFLLMRRRSHPLRGRQLVCIAVVVDIGKTPSRGRQQKNSGQLSLAGAFFFPLFCFYPAHAQGGLDAHPRVGGQQQQRACQLAVEARQPVFQRQLPHKAGDDAVF